MTVIFTDIVDATKRAADLGDGRWRDLLAHHDEDVRKELARFDGREVKTVGDGFLATFDGPPSRALRCSLAITAAARALGIEVRVGIHTGECELIGDDVGGMAVHIASRVSGLARANEVLVSGTVFGTVVGGPFNVRGPRLSRAQGRTGALAAVRPWRTDSRSRGRALRRRLESYRLTPAGGAMLMLLVAAVVLLLFGPKHDEVPAFVVIVAILAIFVMGSSSGGLTPRARQQRTLSDYRNQFHPHERSAKDEPETAIDEELWRRERERREQKSRGTD